VLPLSILGGEFHAETPTIFSQDPKFLSGPVYYSDVTGLVSNIPFVSNYSSAFFTMGYGYASASPADTTLGFSIDVSQLFGISLLVNNN
jgi:hypothetical protein